MGRGSGPSAWNSPSKPDRPAGRRRSRTCGQRSGRVRTRSFASVTGSATPTGTPERSHACRVHATGSNPGGKPLGARLCRSRAEGVTGVSGVLCAAVIVIPDRCAQQTTTSSGHRVMQALHVGLLWIARAPRCHPENAPPTRFKVQASGWGWRRGSRPSDQRRRVGSPAVRRAAAAAERRRRLGCRCASVWDAPA